MGWVSVDELSPCTRGRQWVGSRTVGWVSVDELSPVLEVDSGLGL